MRFGLWRKLSAEELMLLNCGAGEDSWESLGLQGDPTSPHQGDQSWVFIGRTDVEAETPILWPPDAKSWLIGKDPDAGKDWGQEEKGTTEDETVGWHHWFNGHGFGFWELVMDRKAWHAVVHGVTKSQTRLSNWTEGRNQKNMRIKCGVMDAVLRWQRNRTGEPLSPPQIHRKIIWCWATLTKQLLNTGRGH